MKNISIYILVLLGLLSCNKNKSFLNGSHKFYLNRDSIEIIEFKDNHIDRFLLKDSTMLSLGFEKIKFLHNSKNALKIIDRDSLIYYSIDIDINSEIDLESSKYWVMRLKEKGEFWFSFYKEIEIDSLGNKDVINGYSQYSSLKEINDIYYSFSNNSYRWNMFNRFNIIELGNFNELFLLSKINDDSIKLIPIESFSPSTIDIKPLYLEKYTSFETDLHIGQWKLLSTTCENFNYFFGNNLIISHDSLCLTGSKNKFIKSKIKLGLNSKYILMKNQTSNPDYIYLDDIKILNLNKDTLKIKQNGFGSFCKNDTLIFIRDSNPQK